MNTKNNLLGKIAFFDKLLILIVIVAISFFVFVFFRKGETVAVTVRLNEDNSTYGDWNSLIGTRPWVTELLRNDAKLKDAIGRISAEIISVRSFDIKPNRQAVYVKMRLRVTNDRASNQFIFNGLPLIVGSEVKINFDTVLVDGMVTDIEGLPETRQKVSIWVEANVKDENNLYSERIGIAPSIASEILNINEIRDGEGNIIMKVLEKKVTDSDVFVTTSDGRGIIRKNPLRKDVLLKLQINAFKIGNRYYIYDDIPILIGQKIPFNTDKLSVFPEVTKISLSEK